MSVPPDQMQAQQGLAVPPMGDMGAPAPSSAPMTAPAMPEGQRMAAMAQIGNVLDVMEQTLPKLGMDTPEGQAVMTAMQGLNKVFGNYRSKMKELQPAQIMQLLRALPTQMRGQASGQQIP